MRNKKIEQITPLFNHDDIFRVHSACDQIIYIPKEYGNVSNYRRTLAHMVRHSFKPNSEFQLLDSSRYNS